MSHRAAGSDKANINITTSQNSREQRSHANCNVQTNHTNRMEYYLSHELVLIRCGKRTDSVQPDKNRVSRKRKKNCCTPFFSSLGGPNGSTEPEQIPSHLMRCKWTPQKMDVDATFPWACAKHIVRTNWAGDAENSACSQARVFTRGKTRITTRSPVSVRSVPLVPMLYMRSEDTPS